MPHLSPDQISANMSAVRSTGSLIEKLLCTELWKLGLRYRKNDKSVFGKPDIVFKSIKLAVFCDSEFWHGKDWKSKKYEIKSNKDFWYKKIERNIERDKEVNRFLRKQGWKILRFWGKDILKNKNKCAKKVLSEYITRINSSK